MDWMEAKKRRFEPQHPPPYRPDNWIDKALWAIAVPICWVVNKLMELWHKLTEP